jgi:hypothetical protein
MSRLRPSFPPDVADALQRPAGSVSVRYTVPGRLAHGPLFDMPLMETSYEEVLAALTLDTKHNLRFVRTGSRREGARVALVNVGPLVVPGLHWDIQMSWDPERMHVAVRDQQDPNAPPLEGRWPPR